MSHNYQSAFKNEEMYWYLSDLSQVKKKEHRLKRLLDQLHEFNSSTWIQDLERAVHSEISKSAGDAASRVAPQE